MAKEEVDEAPTAALVVPKNVGAFKVAPHVQKFKNIANCNAVLERST